MKKYLLFFIILFLLLIPVKGTAIVQKSEYEFVTDEANLLNDDSEDYIVKYSSFLYKSKKIDFYVVTVKNLENEMIEEYTTQVFNDFKISDLGLLLLVSKDERQLRVQVGDKLLKTITPDLIDEYIETYFMPYLKNDDWNDGIINGYSAFYKYICEEYGIDATTMEVIDQVDFFTKYRTILMMIIIWLVVVFVKIYDYFQNKISKYKSEKIPDSIIFALVVVILANIFVVSVAYVLKPIFIIFVIVFEGFFLYSNLSPDKEEKSTNDKPKIHKIKQRKIKKHK